MRIGWRVQATGLGLALAISFSAAAQKGGVGAAETVVRIVAAEGRVDTVRVKRNQLVRLEVSTGSADELHLHGYDLTAQSSRSQPAIFRFKAMHTGRFAIVTHGHARKGLLQRSEQPVAYVEVRTE